MHNVINVDDLSDEADNLRARRIALASEITRALPTGAGRSTFSYLILNSCKQFTKLYILLTMMVILANMFARLVNIIRGV
jgi:hypothetical protein